MLGEVIVIMLGWVRYNGLIRRDYDILSNVRLGYITNKLNYVVLYKYTIKLVR